MAAALKHVREAEEELEKASNEYGGHRVMAMSLTKQAESETEQGIQWYDQHISPGTAAPVCQIRLLDVLGRSGL